MFSTKSTSPATGGDHDRQAGQNPAVAIAISCFLQWSILGPKYPGSVFGFLYLDLEFGNTGSDGVQDQGATYLPVVWFHWISWRRVGSVSRREIASASGEISRWIHSSRNDVPVHKIHMEKRHFRVLKVVFHAVEEDPTYRIYYQPNRKVLPTTEKM